MCQLLGMNGNTPTDICFSFEGFRTRGGLTDVHKDGWGIAFFEGPGCRVFLDVEPSAQSAVAELVRHYPIHSKNVIAHIRKATQGRIALENTHPFQRELWGRYWLFAHNGNLKEFAPVLDGSFVPVGDTDSELAFCFLLQRLRKEFGDAMPLRRPMFDFLAGITREISAHGEFNFLLSNGNCLYAHCATKLAYILRQAPFAVAHLTDQDVSIDFSEVTNPDDRVAVIATLPLTDNETWTTMEAGTLMVFHEGVPGGRGAHCMKTVAGHTARKRFGQNFLVSDGVIRKIVDAIAPRAGDTVVEIGPGLGALTEPLLERIDHLHVVEIDRDLIARLRQRFPPERLTIHEGDALEFDFGALKGAGRLKLGGNLPYNISSPLLFHLVPFAPLVYDMHFMLQKEVVDRMVAAPGSKDFGRLSVMLQYRYHMERLFVVPPGAFNPPPKVDSAIVRMIPVDFSKVGAGATAKDPALFAEVVTAAFSQRRKMLRNTLRDYIGEAALAALGITPTARAEDIAVADYVRLANTLADLARH